MVYRVSTSNKNIIGEITLDGSKSISNRALIIRALCEDDFEITNLSTSKDTVTLNKLLSQSEETFDAGAAGTTFRFMTAYLAMQEGTQILTGSERMKQRPIGILVEALRKLGASIDYLENEGYPPLKINTPADFGTNNKLSIAANTSSQYISALMMIAPTLPNGLELTLDGKIVSRTYLEMTLNLMKYFGIEYTFEGNQISIAPQKYQAKDYKVEADWSAASYYYSLAALSDQLDLQLNGVWKDSVQGDSVLATMMEHFGVQSSFNKNGVHLSKTDSISSNDFEWDFIRCPDIAQTLAVVCAGLGVTGVFTGLETLSIKETDRIAAVRNELAKVGVSFSLLPGEGEAYYKVDGKAKVTQPTFPTYEDHRMAMAFAPLALLGDIEVEEPGVVVKSYPKFWDDFSKLGIIVTEN